MILQMQPAKINFGFGIDAAKIVLQYFGHKFSSGQMKILNNNEWTK